VPSQNGLLLEASQPKCLSCKQ